MPSCRTAALVPCNPNQAVSDTVRTASTTPATIAPQMAMGVHLPLAVIALAAFLTVVDLFATQAILPSLTAAYGVSPAAMGLAVNASTFGMAVAGLAVALFSRHIDRRIGTTVCLAVLAIPTALLASAPDLASFAALRVGQGLCMAAAFSLTLAYLAETCSAEQMASAFAAYITGNVASNLVGRLVAAGVVDALGLEANFYLFALLNLTGAALVFVALRATRPMAPEGAGGAARWAALAGHLRNPRLLATLGIGFCILFAFIGTFTFVNFILVAPPLALGMTTLGVVYLVFLPSIATTTLAGRVVNRLGAQTALWIGLGVALAGLPLLLVPALASVLAGLTLVAAGTFFAQATATGHASRVATGDRGAASGLYLASYFLGGLAGTAVLGPLFDGLGWPAAVAGIALALAAAMALALVIGPRAHNRAGL